MILAPQGHIRVSGFSEVLPDHCLGVFNHAHGAVDGHDKPAVDLLGLDLQGASQPVDSLITFGSEGLDAGVETVDDTSEPVQFLFPGTDLGFQVGATLQLDLEGLDLGLLVSDDDVTVLNQLALNGDVPGPVVDVMDQVFGTRG